MPYEEGGTRKSVIATKATAHGRPVVERKRFAGIAAKSAAAAPAAVSVANATAAQQIAIGEEFVIMLAGLHEVATSILPAGAVEGDRLYVQLDDNSLADAAEALTAGILEPEYSPLGILDEVDATLGRAKVNLNLKGLC
jgi:hypothetical protein